MSREEFIGKLQMVYVGDRNAFNDIVCAYDSVLSANEKAVEYIKSNTIHYTRYLSLEKTIIPKLELQDNQYNILLNILQNGSDEEWN